MQCTRLVILFLILSILFTPITVLAEDPVTPNPATPNSAEQEENSADDKVKILKNIAQLLRSFVNLDTTFNFMSDDIFIKNQCLRRDVMAVHAMKTQVSDFLISNYTSITQSQLQIYSDMYTTFTGELYFLRNINTLRNPETNQFDLTPDRIQDLKQIVLSRMPDKHSAAVNTLLPDWLNRYEDRLIEYATCENSWTGVVKKVDSIIESAEEVAKVSQALGDSFMDLGETILNTPELFYLNTRNNLAYSVLGSYYEMRDMFAEDLDAIREEGEVFANARDLLVSSRLTEQSRLLGTGQTLGQSFLNNNSSLQNLIDATANTIDFAAAREDYLRDLAMQSTINYFADNSNLLFMQYLVDANAEIIVTNGLLTQDDEGLIDLAKRVGAKQCSA